ncbi:putative calcium-dependent channel, 7TM region phosphate [Helianthus annuus]|uniref:Calcium-dependent channel, 7TM region phosphate n=2 Tax=Helianthus annuus TaxID=4232 RepID=A0A251U9P4_HELAN|nr:CSC1-like protein RXW8 isoform X1 [Helianthus annuus]XP_021972513.1 CSC1-like protein RXW8 isoform X1 [Helianthus annuus]KAF5797616.1 putative calcium-dependent channel, 7TM region phosphate [Helianthus annuus]KAJ0549332.1 putative calcium-dependent channel, 7TM region phosphate [Helianthus annuus]KAJ0562285.1 putative calcium-dependent channel, 7TM region phosphate [Helianthus annuus]KAJ0727664.1 putative calcium-dependent channel, 7TM region phosphate [Helianthus annuus]KAJ0730459.1 puta
MDIPALLTSAGMNIGISVGMFTLYSILRKQPLNVKVYFGQRIAQGRTRNENLCFERFAPSASWILKAWQATEEDIFASGGIDAVVFLRIVVFSIRIFAIATILCTFLVLPLNYFGEGMEGIEDPTAMDLLTIGNVREGSRWLWAHCFTLYVISACACTLLYFEYENVARMRTEQVQRFPTRPSNFTVVVRGIPWSSIESYSESVGKFFSNYYASSYISHQIVYRFGAVQQLMEDAEKMYKVMTTVPVMATIPDKQCCEPNAERCGLCGAGAGSNSFKKVDGGSTFANRNVNDELREKECEAALVFFRSRFDALVVSQTIQSADPMLWVTELAPEPLDVFWQNLCVPYNLLWIRKISVFIASIVFSVLFLLPTTFVQGLTKIQYLQNAFPFLRRVSDRSYINLITGYLPSLVLTVFLTIVPPLMMLFSTLEGRVSRSTRKRSACVKVLIFMFWNVYFSNILSGSWIERMGKLTVTSPKDLATLLAELIPRQASFFMTYVMTSGWSGLTFELLQPVPLVGNWLFKCVLMKEDDFVRPMTFSFHTEVTRVLLFGLLGFTFCILAPLILPFLLVYFCFAFLVYRNQIMNVYYVKYQTDGSYWTLAHNATIFSLILTQVVAGILFGMKKSSTASTCTIPLIICTALFNVFCKNRFLPLFKNRAAQEAIEMDRDDEKSGKLQELVEKLPKAYNQFELCGDEMQLPPKEDDDKHSDKPKKSGSSSSSSSSNGLEELEIVQQENLPGT